LPVLKSFPELIALGQIGESTIEWLVPATHSQFYAMEQFGGGVKETPVKQLAPFPA
jgi:hypothetical protein